MTIEIPPAQLSDEQLVAHIATMARDERRATARLVAALIEFDARKLYLAQGCSSLFTYCTTVLHLSESATYNRIEAARAAARFPSVLVRLRDGSLTLTAVRLLAPLLNATNCEALLDAAAYQSRREVERLVASTRPRPDVPAVIRKLPEPGSDARTAAHLDRPIQASQASLRPSSCVEVTRMVDAAPSAAARPAIVAPLSPERYKIQFTASRALHDKLRRAQELLRHRIPNGDLSAVVERTLDHLIADVEKRRLGAAERPRPARPPVSSSRHIPAAVKREVSRRDRERCAFVGAAGRCQERAFLEFHHVRPFADGGPSTVENIQLRCRAHNAYEAELLFGRPVGDQAMDS